MRIRITDAATNIRDVPYDEMGIKEYTSFVSKDQLWDYLWVYDVIDQKKFFLSVIKYGITFVHEHECSV
jgi:hypothetical protein